VFLAVTMSVLVAGGVTAPPASAHEAAPVADEYIKGVFTPAFAAPAVGSYDLPAIKRVPGFRLLDATGRAVSTEALMAGKLAVVSFVYTGCSDRLGCPLASLALRELQARLRDAGLASAAALVSISIDPGRDSPAQLARYAAAYGADPAVWRFLTAESEDALRRVLDAYGQDRAPVHDARGRFTGRYRHVLKVFLVDRRGNIRNIYSTGLLAPELVINDIKTVLAEDRRAAGPGAPLR